MPTGAPRQGPTSARTPGQGSELGLSALLSMYPAGGGGGGVRPEPLKQGALRSLPHCHPTELGIVFVNKARPGVALQPLALQLLFRGLVVPSGRRGRGRTSWPRGVASPAPLALPPAVGDIRQGGQRLVSVIFNRSALLLWILKHYWRRHLNMRFQEMSKVLECDFSTSVQNQFPPRNAFFLKKSQRAHKIWYKEIHLQHTPDQSTSSHTSWHHIHSRRLPAHVCRTAKLARNNGIKLSLSMSQPLRTVIDLVLYFQINQICA